MVRTPKPTSHNRDRTTIGLKPAVKNLVLDYARDGEPLGEAIRRAIVLARRSEA
jgi:hypothetical protein